MKYDAIVVNESDSVATALRDLEAGKNARFANKGDREINLRDAVRFGHKFAIRDIQKGEQIKKYGETIGRAICDIPPGSCVHVHNVESLRGRGDNAKS